MEYDYIKQFITQTKMKRILSFTTVFFIAILLFTSCMGPVIVKSPPKKVPPGQMKKATGSQSAKSYAPGQQKKKH
jgi:hypothetical protein